MPFGITVPQGASTGFWVAVGILAALFVVGLVMGLARG